MYFDERENYLDYIGEEVNNYIKVEDKDYNEFSNHETYKFKDNKIYDINNININNFRDNMSNDLSSPKDALNKGGIFKSIYDPYKNHIYKVVVKGERDEMLLAIQELTFAMKDLILYLDVHPDDMTVYDKLKSYSKELETIKKRYEGKYGPLTAFHVEGNKYSWYLNPWPWDKGGK